MARRKYKQDADIKHKEEMEKDMEILKKADINNPVGVKISEELNNTDNNAKASLWKKVLEEQIEKKQVNCINFLMATEICVGDLVNIKYGVSRVIGVVKTISPYALVVEAENSEAEIIRLKYISSITVLQKAFSQNTDKTIENNNTNENENSNEKG